MPRYEKAEVLLRLALDLQAARYGLSLAEMQERFGIGRRTAMRMRDAILNMFPQAEEVETDERTKRWRIPAGVLNQLLAFSAEELADLEAAAKLFEQQNMPERATSLSSLTQKLRALMKPDVQRRVEPDLEILLQAEGLAMRPGPRPAIRFEQVEKLREAMKSGQKVAIRYRNRGGKVNRRVVHPYGFLVGHRHYLIGFHENPKANNVVPFALPGIEDVEILAETFERDPNFSLTEYAEQSFGLWHEAAEEVVWRFTPEAAATAHDFVFHPKQVLEPQPDGSLIVRFRAGGVLEMAWYLYSWGDQVEVLAPASLVELVRDHRPHWPGTP